MVPRKPLAVVAAQLSFVFCYVTLPCHAQQPGVGMPAEAGYGQGAGQPNVANGARSAVPLPAPTGALPNNAAANSWNATAQTSYLSGPIGNAARQPTQGSQVPSGYANPAAIPAGGQRMVASESSRVVQPSGQAVSQAKKKGHR